MLAQQQPIALVQRHVERVLAGQAGVAVIVALLLHRVVPVHGVHAALPRLIADAGADDDLRALPQGGGVVLVDVALHPEAAGLHDGHEGQGVAVVVAAAVFVDGLHLAGYLGLDGGVLQVVLHLLDVLLLGGNVGLVGQDVQIGLSDLKGILPAGGVIAGLIPLLLQILLFALLVLQLVLLLLQLQLRLLQIALQFAQVVGEQHITHRHRVAHLYLDGVHGEGVILFDLRLAQGADNAAEAVGQAHRAQSADHGHGLNGGLALRLAAAGQ